MLIPPLRVLGVSAFPFPPHDQLRKPQSNFCCRVYFKSFKRRGAVNTEGRPGRGSSLGDIENILSTALGQFNTLKEVAIIVVIRNPLPSLNVMVRPT